MVKKTILVAAFAVVAAWFCVSGLAQRGPATDTRAAVIAVASQKFLGTLDDSQRSKVVFDFKDAEQRKRWSNLPVGSVPRAGEWTAGKRRRRIFSHPRPDGVHRVCSPMLGRRSDKSHSHHLPRSN